MVKFLMSVPLNNHCTELLISEKYTGGLASMCIKSKIAMLPENLTMTLFLWLLEHSFVCSVEKEQVS